MCSLKSNTSACVNLNALTQPIQPNQFCRCIKQRIAGFRVVRF